MRAGVSKSRGWVVPVVAGTLGLLVLALYAGSLSAVLRGATEDALSPASAVVVYGAYIKPGGKPGPEVLLRAARGVTLTDAGFGSVLTISGGRIGGGEPVGRIMATLASQSGLNIPKLLLDEESITLEQCAAHVTQLARAQSWGNVVFVAGRLEMARARLVFARRGVSIQAAPPIPIEQAGIQDGLLAALPEAARYMWDLLFYRG